MPGLYNLYKTMIIKKRSDDTRRPEKRRRIEETVTPSPSKDSSTSGFTDPSADCELVDDLKKGDQEPETGPDSSSMVLEGFETLKMKVVKFIEDTGKMIVEGLDGFSFENFKDQLELTTKAKFYIHGTEQFHVNKESEERLGKKLKHKAFGEKFISPRGTKQRLVFKRKWNCRRSYQPPHSKFVLLHYNPKR